MELTLISTELDRSLQRRWALTEAEPVPAALHPNETFIPADLRIWWQVEDGEPAGEDTLHANAWPAEREPYRFADWRDQRNMPSWIRELSTAVHADVLANTTSQNTCSDDRWAHCLKRKWILEGADVLPATRYNRKPSFRLI